MSSSYKPFSKFILLITFLGYLSIQCSKDGDPSASGSGSTSGAVSTPKKCSNCTFVVAASQGTIDGKALGVKPGDTICLNAAFKYGTLTFKNIVGTAAKPVIITNCDGTVNIALTGKPFNLKTSNSKYFRITGGDTEKSYGIRLSGSTANGVILTDLSTNFEVDHMEVFKVGFAGIMAKTDPTCDDATIRGNFTMRNVSFHDNYIHDTQGEGFYIGHSFYGGETVTGCGVRLPHTIEGIDIYNNHVVRSGWDGIQMSCATKNARVFGNTVEDYAVLNKAEQQNGILIGGGSGGTCFGNFVNGGTGNGICTFGLGDNLFHDNIVINAGQKGMFCDVRGVPTGNGFKFVNNTVVNPKEEGIAIYSYTLPNNVCINNIIVNPGTFSTYKESAYIRINKNAPTEKSNNYTTLTIGDVKFVNSKNNFRLKTGSPAIDKGKDISSYVITKDFYNNERHKGSAYDIGASEF